MIHPITDIHLSILGSCIILFLAMPRRTTSLFSTASKLPFRSIRRIKSPLRCLKSTSRAAPKPKPSLPSLFDGLAAISHILVVVVASNLASGGPAFETRLFITLRQQLLEYSRPAALLAASTAIPIPRRESQRTASICDDKTDLIPCDSAQTQPARPTTPLPAQADLTRPSTPLTTASRPSTPSTLPSRPTTPFARPPPIPRRSSSLNKVFDARRVKLVITASPSSSTSSLDRESRTRTRPEAGTETETFRVVRGKGSATLTFSEKGKVDPCFDSRVRGTIDPGMWLRSGRVAASARVM